MRAHTLACLLVLCLLGAGCSADVPTAPAVPAAAAPLHDGIGWTGGGGRSADSTNTASAAGIGWVGGGG
ncbi:MAG TPA: hypothetical protein VFQ76_00045 [Longimicrobiaceae bacterium]|nr:hypothetical protein [Longimicrobiaceae bacterium]